MFCTGCGNQMNENAKFCTHCGKPNPRMQAPGSGTGAPVPPPQPQNSTPQGYNQAGGNTVPQQTYQQQYSAPQQNVQQPNYSQQAYRQPQQNNTPQPEPKKKSGGKIALLIILPAEMSRPSIRRKSRMRPFRLPTA